MSPAIRYEHVKLSKRRVNPSLFLFEHLSLGQFDLVTLRFD